MDLSQDPDALQRIFAGLRLAEPGEPVVAEPLPGGVSSGIYRVALRSGDWCVKQALPRLKVAKEWRVPVERVFHEIEWLRTAHALVPGHVPKVVGEDRATGSFVMPMLGSDHRNWKTLLLAGEIAPGVARQAGDVLGRIHAATADRPHVAERFDTGALFHALRLEPYLEEAARVHPHVADRLLELVARTARTRRVLVHGDVSPKNILVGPQGPVLLDAECAWFGDPAFDLAFCLNHFLLKAAHRPEDAARLMLCFQGFALAYAAHVDWELAASVDARAAALLPALALARIDGKSPVEYLGATTRERVRDGALALLAAPPAMLDGLAQQWTQEFKP
ncbi:MAG TPA: phosphotransferase [Ramlibacter sp.]|nr:phosphotransferase [Ramlibacter sp.]